MERTAHQVAQCADPDGPAAELRSALALPDAASPSESEQLRAGLRQHQRAIRMEAQSADPDVRAERPGEGFGERTRVPEQIGRRCRKGGRPGRAAELRPPQHLLRLLRSDGPRA